MVRRVGRVLNGETIHRGMVALGIPVVVGLLGWILLELYNGNRAIGEITVQVGTGMNALRERMDRSDQENRLAFEALLHRIERDEDRIMK